jgi:hypothetical protein
MDTNFKYITEGVFLKFLDDIGFTVKEKQKYNYTLYFGENKNNVFIFNKINKINALNFFLFKPESKFPLYTSTIRQLGIYKGDTEIKKMLKYPFDNYYFDNDTELIGIYDFVFGLLKENAYDYFYGNLDVEIFNFIVNEKKEFKKKYDRFSTEDKFKIMCKFRDEWDKQRFIKRNYL